jgi:glycosyltransferase involved in cell wall biosynthesis
MKIGIVSWESLQSIAVGPLDIVLGHDWLTTRAAVWARRVRDYEWEAQYPADAVAAVSNTLKEEMIRIYGSPREKIHTIYNGVEVHRFDGWINQGLVKTCCEIGPLDPMVLFVGRMACQKGPDLLVGDGEMRWHLEEQVRTRGLGEATRFLGKREGEELADIYRSAC